MASSPALQQPTCTDTFVRSVADVHKIFYAVILGRIPLITRRLDAAERDALRSGCCYVWEDRGSHSVTGLGIERFTEGRHWSASRVRDDFLFYYEKYKGGSSTQPSTSDNDNPPRDWDPLVKQTYSVYVNPCPGQPEPNPPKKWHLTAYYTESSIDRLRAVDNLPECAGLTVPEGMFRCSRSVKPRSRAGKAKAARERAIRDKSGLSDTSATAPSNSAGLVKEEQGASAGEKVEEKPVRPQTQVQPVAGPSRVKSERTSPPLSGLGVDTDLSPQTRTPIASGPLSAPAAGGWIIVDRRLAGSNIASPATAHYTGPNIGLNIITQSPSVAQFATSGSNIFGASGSGLNNGLGSSSSHLAGSNIQSQRQPSLYDPANEDLTNTNASASAPAQDPSYPLSSLSAYAELNTQTQAQGTAYGSPIHPPAPATASPTSPYLLSATSPPQGYFAAALPQSYASNNTQQQQQQQQGQGYFSADSSGPGGQNQQGPFRPASQQAFRPSSSLAGALDPDAVSNLSKPGSRRSSMNYAASTSFSVAAQRMGSFVGMSGLGSDSHSHSPSPPHLGSVGPVGGGGGAGSGLGGMGTMMPPPLPPLGINASGMDVGSVDMSMGSMPTPAPTSSSLGAAMGAPPASTGQPVGKGFAQATSPVHLFLAEHLGAGEFVGFPAPAPAPQAHAPPQDDAFNVTPAGFSFVPGYGAASSETGWDEQQQQQQQPPPSYIEYGNDAYMTDAHSVSLTHPTYFSPQSPYTTSTYVPSPNPTSVYAFASPAPSVLSLSSGSSSNSGQQPGMGYQVAEGFGSFATSHMPFQACSPFLGTPFQSDATAAGYGTFEKGGTPFSPVVGSFQPGAPFVQPQMRVPRGSSEGHSVSPTQTHVPFDPSHTGPPSNLSPGGAQQQQLNSSGMITGWAGERRAALAPQSNLRRFKPYSKPRDPVDEATVRALGGIPGA